MNKSLKYYFLAFLNAMFRHPHSSAEQLSLQPTFAASSSVVSRGRFKIGPSVLR